MKFGALLTACIVFFSALALALPDCADAARMGGGRSFGGSPTMRAPASRPAARTPAATSQTPGAAQRPGMFGGMGGMLGGLLAGTMLGSLLSGNGLGGGGFMDILLIGILAFIGYKLFTRFRNRQAQQAGGVSPGMYRNNASNPFGGGNVGGNAAGSGFGQNSGWDNLGGQSASNAQTANIPPNFNVDEFLRGAKMVYNRMQKSWNQRDLQDIAQFATPAVMNELERQAAQNPNPDNTEIMLVNAELLGVEKQGNEERAQVYFDVMMREDPKQQTPENVREIWHFLRVGNGEWKLDGIQQVE